MMTKYQKKKLDELISSIKQCQDIDDAIKLAEEIRDNPNPELEETMDEPARLIEITPRELVSELNLIPEEHRDKPISYISCIGNRTKNVMSILLRPFGEIEWTVDENGYIALDFVPPSEIKPSFN